MIKKTKCSCCSSEKAVSQPPIAGEYICYCNKVTEQDIITAMKEKGATTVEDIIKITGAMVNSNCKVNNPKGDCCYPDIVQVFNQNR